tara:strand:- start:606 stop:854 length:249 start_codon:yes stop_codon:yes gene_type:complete
MIYQIKKTVIVLLNNSLGDVLEYDNFDKASQLCQIMNSNSNDLCRYEIQVAPNQFPQKQNKNQLEFQFPIEDEVLESHRKIK